MRNFKRTHFTMTFAPPYPFCFFFLLPLLPYSTTAQPYKNISLGSSLTALNDNNSSWASLSGEFAFGFQQVEKGGFLLAIWFNKIPEKTVVWSANRNKLAPTGAKVQLTTDGVILNGPKGEEIWTTSGSSARTGSVASAAMLDTGNFVLTSPDSSVNLWESFKQPTDTLLPTQTLNQGGILLARYSENNFSVGKFMFSLQPDGNLVLYTTAYPLEYNVFAYWSTQSSIGSGFQVIFNQSGYIYLAAKNGSILNQISSNSASTKDFYHRATLEYDGIFRQYVYPKKSLSDTGRWPMAWSPSQTIPSNICLRTGGDIGGGVCGFNSYCTLGDDQRPRCECPTGYIPLDSNNEMNGCKQNFYGQSCDKASPEVHLFDFKEMLNADWASSAYESFKPVGEDWCRDSCLGDCFCAVAIFKDAECSKKKTPLSNGRIDSSVGGKALIKVRKDNSTLHRGPLMKKDQSTLILIGSVLLGSSVFLNLLLLVATFLFFLHMNQRKKTHPYKVMEGMNLRSFTYKELEQATEGFKDELGRGSFSIVYKGVLAFENQILVAVKKLDNHMREEDQEFKAEMSAIGRTNHKNLVQLLGFCNEGQHRLLVYEFMSHGSLASFLFGNSRPNWYRRIEIAFGTARGLLYLHQECSTQIIHCDIKPQNVLLDDSFTAKISDFGLAKLLRIDQSQTTTLIRGTKGYLAPEWLRNMPITFKVDVYSFGILLLELICCRRNLASEAEDESEIILTDWAYDCYRDGKLELLVSNDEEAKENMETVKKFVMIAIWCIQEDPSLRPNMKKVTQMLEGATQVSIPPDPSSIISSIQFHN